MTEGARYPRLLRRIQAVLIDGIVLVAAFFAAANFISPFEIHGGFKISFVALLFLVLEPGLVSINGATIGHHLRGLRVRDAKTSRNLNIVRATVRFLIKTLFGVPSLILVLITKKHQALHDLASRSVVVLRDPSSAKTNDVLSERTIEEAGFIYPSKIRRTITIILYNGLGVMIIGLLSAIFLSENCLQGGSCTAKDRVYETLSSYVWIAFLAVTIVFGWQGRMWGCKRKKPID